MDPDGLLNFLHRPVVCRLKPDTTHPSHLSRPEETALSHRPIANLEDAVKLRILIASVLSLVAAGFMRAAPSDPAGMVVHEWGTFLAMNGSDGISLDGMYHEEHALPSFVHARSKDQLHLPMSLIKGETPVIYFYTPPGVQYRAQVQVSFPTGIWTQWYPQASTVAPGIVQNTPSSPRNGRIVWDVHVRPRNWTKNRVPYTNPDALWQYARDVDSAFVIDAANPNPEAAEWEKFIFYRGLGQAPLPIQVRLGADRITAKASEAEGVRHVFILRVEKGRGAYAYVPALTTSELEHPVPSMAASQPLDEFVKQVADDMARRLVESGLYEKEARAMVNTWASSYFKTDGVRVLFVMPQSWTDRFIPMSITAAPEMPDVTRAVPRAPEQLVRVMVGRVELLDHARESQAEHAIGALASSDAQVRERAFELLRSEGRYVEPIVRRTAQTSTDEQVRTLARRLLLTDFVTELRTAFTDASTGERVSTEPVYIQAQLASLLREVGLTAEAKQEGESALAQLAKMRQPTMDDHLSRHMFRALARANEGAGHDAEALSWYGKFVEFGSQFQQPKMCAGCHTTMGPRDWSFFKDWYAGRKFGELAMKTGTAPRLVATHETVLKAIPDSRASNLSLAYLYEATGEKKKAEEHWVRLNPAGR
jgi:hypothetical protein